MLGTEPQLEQSYVKSGQVKLVFNPMIDLGQGSRQAHMAATCAGEQGMFWPMHDLLFKHQNALYGSDVAQVSKDLAAQLPLDAAQFNTCIDEEHTADLVQSQDDRRRQLGIRARPTFDVNGQLIVGGQPFEVFQTAIESLLEPK
ncbi:MAG: thioredoxin domain-containing protein [Anaerolineales bacterium]|nr:thioredoxin domain-containing protein [Anaerolineales bacterium]